MADMAECKFKGCATEEFYWRNYFPCEIPCDAFKGPDNKYIGQVNYSNDVCLPVCIYPQCNKAVGEWTGKKEFNKNIRIFCTNNSQKFYWEPIDFRGVTDYQMKNAVVGGYQGGYNLYIGKVYHEGEWKISKVVPKENRCKGLQVWNCYGDCEIISNFDILKYAPVC